MRPLPRVHAVTDAAVLALPDFGIRAAAIASTGSSVALHARDRTAGGATLAAAAARSLALARPPEATVFVTGRPDVAAACGASGVQLAAGDLTPADARRIAGGLIGRSVHSADEARAAVDEGADFLIVGSVYPTASHPARPALGPAFVTACARGGPPVIAIGGIDAGARARGARGGRLGRRGDPALWHAADPAAAALLLLAPWLDAA